MKKNKRLRMFGVILPIVFLIGLIYFSHAQKENFSVIEKISLGITRYFNEFKIKKESREKAMLKGKSLEEIENENIKLKEELRKKEEALNILNIIKQENIQLNNLNNLKTGYSNYEGVTGEIISRNFSNFEKTVVINIGSKQGIRENMTVVADKGLFGRIVSVTDDTAKVQLITDPGSKLGVTVDLEKDSKIILKGDAQKGIILTRLPMPISVIKGTDIYTSGSGGIFPKGIYVGKVRRNYS